MKIYVSVMAYECDGEYNESNVYVGTDLDRAKQVIKGSEYEFAIIEVWENERLIENIKDF